MSIFSSYKIDSFSLLIPREYITLIDSTFEQKYVRVYETGEAEDSEHFYKNTFILKQKGFSVKFQSLKRMWSGGMRDFVKVVVTSKFLHENYFTGINKSNIGYIYDLIIGLQVIDFTEEAFFNSYFSDLDICIDLQVNEEEQAKIKDYYKKSILSKKQKYIQSLRSATNLQINERHKATPRKPFLKFYNKKEELLTKSKDFYSAYLTNQREVFLNGIYRVETTIKNHEHKKSLGIKECSTLNDLLLLPQSELKRVHQSILNEYISKKSVMQTSKNLTPTETILFNAINFLIEFGQGKEMILECLTKSLERNEKYRAKKKLENLFSYISNSDKLEENNKSQKQLIESLKTLGIFDSQ